MNPQNFFILMIALWVLTGIAIMTHLDLFLAIERIHAKRWVRQTVFFFIGVAAGPFAYAAVFLCFWIDDVLIHRNLKSNKKEI